jgi:N-acetylmuramoyl-L-alanine amidase
VSAEVLGRVLHLTLDEGALGLRGRDQEREDAIRRLHHAALERRADLDGVQVWVRLPDGKTGLLNELTRDPAEDALRERLRAWKPPAPRPIPGLPPDSLPYGGSLQGRRIALSPGHGYIWYDNLQAFSTQRGLINLPGCSTCLGIVEDFSNNQIATRYLLPHLLRAGAWVGSGRERDFSLDEPVLDDGDPGVLEQGPWRAGTSPGGHQGDYRVLLAGDGGSVDVPLEAPSEGDYWVTVWYVAGANRVTDALYRVHHQGGVSEHHLDQTADGQRWVSLGRYRLRPGHGRLEILPGPRAEPERYLVADAVRLGGGVDRSQVSGVTSNRPRWQMGARFFLPYLGLPAALDPGSDVTIRPVWAEWQGADAYLSLHSNATGSGTNNATGTSTYRYNCGSYPDHSTAPDPALCDDPPGSDRLQRAVHGAVLEFLRARWDPAWRSRGTLVANFGELRLLDDMPGALVESAFHDGTEAAAGLRMPDNQALQDPRFRHWLGYAMYAGLARFFDPGAPLLPPEPPEGVYLVHAPGGGLLVGWEPLPEALGYRVRWSVDGLGHTDGLHTEGTSALLADLPPGAAVAVRVSGLNAGGEGPPSEWLLARHRGHGAFADLLLVSGFDRQDAYLGDGRNQRDQALAHGQALLELLGLNVYFDCASDEAVTRGAVPLGAYRAAIWILGEESTADETFDAPAQTLARAYLAGGGALMASGAEIGWDLVARGDPADQAFFSETFHARYESDDAGTHGVVGLGEFATAGAFDFDDGSAGIYPVEWPDVLEPLAPDGAFSALAYDTGAGAAVAWAEGPGRSLILGFPFETVTTPEAREALMDACVRFLLPGFTPDDYDGDGLPDAWEHLHGTDPLIPSADEDPDGDGRTNLQEYLEGTDPQVPDGPDASDGADGPDGAGGPDGSDGPDGADRDAGLDETDPGGGCGCASRAGRGGELAALGLLALWGLRLRRRP